MRMNEAMKALAGGQAVDVREALGDASSSSHEDSNDSDGTLAQRVSERQVSLG